MSDRLSKLFSGSSVRDRWSRAEGRDEKSQTVDVIAPATEAVMAKPTPLPLSELIQLASRLRTEVNRYQDTLDLTGAKNLMGQLDRLLAEAAEPSGDDGVVNTEALSDCISLLDEALIVVFHSQALSMRKTGQ